MFKKYSSIRSYLRFLRHYRLRLSLIILSFALADVALAIIPVFIGHLIGSLTAHPIQEHRAVVYTVILILCSTTHDSLWRISELLYRKYINPLSYEYETLIFKHIVHKPYPYFVDKFTGKIASNITTLSQEFRTLIENTYYNYAAEAVSLVAVSIILIDVNLVTGLLFVTLLTLMIVTGRYTIRNSTRYEKVATDVQSTKNGKIIDAIANFVNIKSFQTEQQEIDLLIGEQATVIKSANRSFLWAVFFWGTMSQFVRNLIWPLTIGLNVYLFLHHKIDITQLTTLLSSILLFSNYIWEIIWNVSQFTLRMARTEEAYTYLFGSQLVGDHNQAMGNPATGVAFQQQLELRNLTFAYPDKPDKQVLRHVNLTIKHGEKIGIVGKSGGGKSTLIKLFLGYYDIEPNQLFLDNQTVTSHSVAKHVALVPQDTSLFHRSIAENIAYASDTSPSQEQIEQAAKQAYAHDFISEMRDGYDSLVGERGVKLSTGQRQRIAIARAFLDDKPILVLDEATSALDSESEVYVQRALETLWKGKTVIAIAHRLSTLQTMDRIIVLDKGQITEQGTHQELLALKGTYAKLWAHQSGGFMED